MKNKIYSKLIILLALILCLAACDGAVHLPGLVKISLDVESASIGVGETKQLTAIITPESAKDTPITWESSNTDIATVDDKGLVTGKAAGNTTITAKAGNASATCAITIKSVPVESVALYYTNGDPVENIELHMNDSVTIVAKILPEDATDKTITCTSSDNSKVTVTPLTDNKCLIKCVILSGYSYSVTVTVTVGGVTASCEVYASYA